MDEELFWTVLEGRVSRELDGIRRKGRRTLWCDGIDGHSYDLDGDPPKIEGWCYCGSSGQELWKFTLFLPAPVASREEIDWASLLPPDNVTCWLAFDEERKVLQVEPGAAVPDAPIK